MNIRKLRHIIHRSLEELHATYDLSRAISLKAALITFRAKIDIQIMNRNGYKEPERVKNRLKKKHQVMIDFLEYKFKDFWANYKYSTGGQLFLLRRETTQQDMDMLVARFREFS